MVKDHAMAGTVESSHMGYKKYHILPIPQCCIWPHAKLEQKNHKKYNTHQLDRMEEPQLEQNLAFNKL